MTINEQLKMILWSTVEGTKTGFLFGLGLLAVYYGIGIVGIIIQKLKGK